MKKIIIALFILPLALTVFAQELKIGGEAKSGIYWEQNQREGEDPAASVNLKSTDDAGSGRGRFRLNLDYDNGKGFGMRARLNWETWSDTAPQWPYAFGYGNFFDEQLTVSVGRLGGSPWGTGGPEMWKELEAGNGGGMRVEYKPAWLPVGNLNVGFVLNYFNSDRDQGIDKNVPVSLLNILRESVIGVSYSHDLFMVRFAYRFDDEMDAQQDNKISGGKGEDELVYRVEEHLIKQYLPGFSIWALGHLFGLSSGADRKELKWYRNWLFVEYAPDVFTAQVRIGYDYIDSRSDFYVKPSFYWHFFNKLLSVGAAFEYCQDFGDGKMYEGSPYRYLMVEPKIQLNFTSSYIAFAYNFKQEYLHTWTGLKAGKDPLQQTQWMNLRFCIYY
jgi:hypothetical protein